MEDSMTMGSTLLQVNDFNVAELQSLLERKISNIKAFKGKKCFCILM
jgi:hypothetical protein